MYTKKMFSPDVDKTHIHGSSIPLASLEEYIRQGRSMLDFLDDFPWLKLSDVKNALENIKRHTQSAAFFKT